jgi:DNA (cytosine-5)-methyltransferase 1
VCPEADNEPFYVAMVTGMWEESGEKLFHGSWFNRGRETVLGETGDPTELFLVDSCDDTPLYAILRQVYVKYVAPPDNWCDLGGVEEEEGGGEGESDEDGLHFFYQKWYDADTARFEDLPPHCRDDNTAVKCYSCIRKQAKVSLLF